MRFGRDVDRAVALEVAVEAQLVHGALDLVEVRPAELLKLVELFRKPGEPVLVAVGEAGFAEAAIAPGCGPADPLRLEQHDPGRRVLALGEQRGPQAGVAAADDREIAVRVGGQGRVVVCRGILDPERGLARARQCVADDGFVRSRSFENCAAHVDPRLFALVPVILSGDRLTLTPDSVAKS